MSESESNHAPGPWVLEGDLIMSPVSLDYICTMRKNEGDPFPIADANLITAAPDLLAACKAAKAFMEMIGNPAPPHPFMQIRDAITKAEGNKP